MAVSANDGVNVCSTAASVTAIFIIVFISTSTLSVTHAFRLSQVRRLSTHLAKCPCNVFIIALLNAPNFDALVLRSGQHRVLNFRLSRFNISSRDALSSDLFNHYHHISIPIRASIEFVVRLAQPASNSLTNFPYHVRITDAVLRREQVSRSNVITHCPVLLPEQPPATVRFRQDNIVENWQTRVVGGMKAGNDLAKYMALLLTPRNDRKPTICSGTLVSTSIIITAAHCALTEDTTVFLGLTVGKGKSRSSQFYIKEFRPHPLYTKLSKPVDAAYDIAYVVLNTSVPTQQANFMKVNVNNKVPPVTSIVRAAGYGIFEYEEAPYNSTNSDMELHQVDIPVLSRSDCISIYQEGNFFINGSAQLCAGYVGEDGGGCGSCVGDSGGPLYQYDGRGEPVLVGVVSQGVRCADPIYPGIFVRTAIYEEFLPTAGVTRTRSTAAVMYNSTRPSPINTQGNEGNDTKPNSNAPTENTVVKPEESSGSSTVIIGASVGGVVALLVVGVTCAFFIMKRLRGKHSDGSAIENGLNIGERGPAIPRPYNDGAMISGGAGLGIGEEALGQAGVADDGGNSESPPSSFGSVEISFAGRIAEPRRLHHDDESTSMTSSMAETGESDIYEASTLSTWFEAGDDPHL